jgi:L-fuconolactonase
MPAFPIIDSHIHLIDRGMLPYGWMAQLPSSLQANRSLADYRAATSGTGVATAVAIEFLVDEGHQWAEAAHLDALAAAGKTVAAIVACAPVEKGEAVAADLEALRALRTVRAIRRVIFDPPVTGQPAFVAGVKTVGAFGLPFELALDHRGLSHALALARACPDVAFVLDHLGTPPIAGAPDEHWLALMAEFAVLPNVTAKLSGLMANVVRGVGTRADVVTHLRVAIDIFGPSRVMYGSDWPMFTPDISYADWLAIVNAATRELTDDEQRAVYHDVAARTYDLEGLI